MRLSWLGGSARYPGGPLFTLLAVIHTQRQTLVHLPSSSFSKQALYYYPSFYVSYPQAPNCIWSTRTRVGSLSSDGKCVVVHFLSLAVNGLKFTMATLKYTALVFSHSCS